MTFNFVEKTGQGEVERQDAKAYFILNIGPYKQEFDDANVFVEIRLDPAPSQDKYSFVADNGSVLIDLVDKIKRYRKVNPL